MTTTTAPTRTTTSRRTLWAVQIVLGLFFVIASASPKLFGEPSSIQIFAEIGAGDWLRYFVGLVELAGGVGLLIPRLAGAAALGLAGLMIGATYTQITVFDAPPVTITPVVLGIIAGGIAWARRAEIAALTGR